MCLIILLQYRAFMLGALVLIAVSVTACRSSPGTDVAPRPVLASSPEAQKAWRALVSRWIQAPGDERRELDEALLAFIDRYRGDDRVRVARLYLAWVRLEQNKLDAARSLVLQARPDRPGVAHDFADVIEAAIASRRGDPQGALERLVPLRGKIIDPAERLLFNEELVQAALEAGRYAEAFDYMLDWVEQAPRGERERVQEKVEALLRAVPAEALAARFLDEWSEEDEPGPEERWQRKIALDQLSRTALRDRDIQLARHLLENMPPALRRDEIREALSRLAAQAHALPRVAGRAIGMALELTSSRSRRRSVEVVAGMSRALGLTRGDGSESVRLLTRPTQEDTPEAIDGALASLAGQGAAILVAGVSEDTAGAARAFAERVRIPVLLMARPASFEKPGHFAYAVGSSELERDRALERTVVPRARSVRVGPGGIPCDIEAETAGVPRFPVQAWQSDGVEIIRIAGSAGCARDVADEVLAADLPARFVLGLDALEAWRQIPRAARVEVLGAGALPAGLAPRRPEALQKLTEQLGRGPTWFEALGRDAATIAAAALSRFPEQPIDDPRAVARAHRQASQALSEMTADLWTTDDRTFSGRALERTFVSYRAGAKDR